LEVLKQKKETGAREKTGGISEKVNDVKNKRCIMKRSRMEYIDTSALIALSDKRDKNHVNAVKHLKESVKKGTRFVIGKHVLIEYLDGVTKRIGKEKAIYELDKILNSKIVVLELETKKDWIKSLEYFRMYNDQRIDLTDCLSFALMERLELKQVFTFDSDFRIHGFEVLP